MALAMMSSKNRDLSSSSILRVAAPVFANKERSQNAGSSTKEKRKGSRRHTWRSWQQAGQRFAPSCEAMDGSAVVVHCTAGKDRTGVAVALLLKLCGVDDDLIVRDYAITETLMEYSDEHLTAMAATSRGAITFPMALAMMSSKPEAMTGFLRKLVDTYGSAAGYFSQCGVTAKELDATRAALVDVAPRPRPVWERALL
ncbi:protein-tyrosine phosphatase-like protein [Blyttiomyces helicus]|uniref:Protein-tyrosine phosphatase-like protein n=1 Tax=Blyttiomyces helicus TaxID=388810 RepID=A0A4P9WAQ7_9FUNG|nr:protein-tyrosine phosphatase-like protein [Blyttiomyces helicus]|eukprot:RKO88603.1 protein-tyrosine phosphatase-like protein [Blyttiomyces helicus]